MFDGAAFGKEMVGIVKGYVEKALSPLLKRLDDLEIRSVGISEEVARQLVADAVAKAIADIPAPPEPWHPDDDEIRTLLQPMVDALPAPENGKSVTVEDVAPLIAEQVAKAVSAISPPAPVEPSDDRLKAIVGPLIEAWPKPENGKSVTVEDVMPLISEEVARAVKALPTPVPVEPTDDRLKAIIVPLIEALPVPENGKSVTLTDVAPMIADQVAKAVSALPAAKDGVGLAGAIIDRDGHLVVTLTDGATKELGPVVGKDVDERAVEARLKELVDAIPKPRDGVDGFGFDDMSADYDGERGLVLRFVRGERVKEFAFSMPVVIDRGVWLEGKDGGYAKGDGVTWAGSFWISQKDDNTGKPDGGDGWRLAVKRGRDGKPGKDGEIKAREPVKVG